MTDVWYGEGSVLRTLGAAWLSAEGYSVRLPVILSGYTQ
jgi:hypothetical protein